jgi:hypothetical protein
MPDAGVNQSEKIAPDVKVQDDLGIRADFPGVISDQVIAGFAGVCRHDAVEGESEGKPHESHRPNDRKISHRANCKWPA